jgi:hypothetical protein
MSLRSQFKASAEKTQKGVWKEFEPNSDGSIPAFLIARFSVSNPKYLKVIQDQAQANGDKVLTIADEEKQAVEAMADAIILDWRNIQVEDDGILLSYSRANVIQLLGDSNWQDLKIELRLFALNIANYRDEVLNNAVKK